MKPHFGFEIDYLPNGLLGNEGFKRAVQLIDPANTTTRRLDPTMFFKRVELGLHPELVLAAGHVGHPLLVEAQPARARRAAQRVQRALRRNRRSHVNGVRTSINIPAGDRGMLRLAGGGTIGVELPTACSRSCRRGAARRPHRAEALTLPRTGSCSSFTCRTRTTPRTGSSTRRARCPASRRATRSRHCSTACPRFAKSCPP